MKQFIIVIFCLILSSPALAMDDYDSHFIMGDYSKKISMDFKQAALVDVLKIFSKQSGKNFVAATDISTKTVTLYFENIPFEEALEKLLEANDLTYESKPDSNVIIIKQKPDPKTLLITKVYPLKYASVSSAKINSLLNVSADSSSSSSSDSSSSSSSASTSTSGSGSGGSTDSGIVSGLMPSLSALGKIIEDARTNSLVITDKPEQFPVIEATLAKLDVKIPLIIIKLEMLDISKQTSDKIGIKYGDEPLTFTGGERDVMYPFRQGFLEDKGYVFEDAEYRVGTISAKSMTAKLNFIKSQADSKSLAKPRIMTLNNQSAQIKISTNETVGKKVTTASGSGSGTSTTTSEAERVETGVFLTVTPQANLETREIMMALYPKVIQAREVQLGSDIFKDPEERGSQSLIRIKDGETIVMGGLLREDNSVSVSKLPILGDLPLVGKVFQHKSKSNQQRELIIFITPQIVYDDNSYNEKVMGINPIMSETKKEVKKLKKRNKRQ